MKLGIFDYFFITLLLLLFFFGNTYLKWLVLVFGLSGLFYFREKVNLNNKSKENAILILWLAFLLFSVLSFLFSTNIPLSLDKISIYLFSFIGFYWVNSVKNKKNFLIKYIHILFFFHVIISFLFVIYISDIFLRNFFLESNLLYIGHGHSHFASWLLFINPLFLWFSINKDKRMYFLSTTNYLLLFFCFGRIGILIGFFQLLFFFITFKEKMIKKDLIVFIFLFLISTASSLVYVLSQMLPNQLTLFANKSFWNTKINKNFYLIDRVSYWVQAWKVFLKNPFFGSGIGTYPLSVREVLVSPSTNSAHAHNSYLEIFAEMGIFGGISFVGLIVSLIISAIKRNQNKYQVSFPLLIGLISLSVNALFDYDWNYLLIFFVTIFSFGLICKNKVSNKRPLHFLLLGLFKIFYKASLLLIVLVTCLYIVLEALILTGHQQKAFYYFPYILWHKHIFFEKAPSDKLFSIYHADSSFLLQATKSDLLNENNKYLASRLSKEPWIWMTTNRLGELIEKEEWELAGMKAEELIVHLFDRNWRGKENYYSLMEQQREVIASNYIKLGDFFFQKHNHQKAGDFYYAASKLDDWIFSKYLPIFVTQMNFENMDKRVVVKLLKTDENQWGDNRMLWSEYLIKYLARVGVVELSQDEVGTLILSIKDFSGLSPYELFNWFFDEINNNHEYFFSDKNYVDQKKITEKQLEIANNSYFVWKKLKNFDQKLDKEREKQLANMLIVVGNSDIALTTCQTSSFYEKAYEIRPEIFFETDVWFEKISSQNYNSDQTLCYLQDYSTKLRKMMLNRVVDHIKLCQQEIESSLKNNKPELAIEYAKIMRNLEPREFYSQMQLGNVYFFLGREGESLEAFNYCVQHYQNEDFHYGCKEAINLIKQNNYSKNAVYKIGKVVEGL